MILLALILQAMASAPADASSPDVAAEVVVIGERLKNWRGDFRSRKGKFSCKTAKSSGDAGIDRLGCAAMADCWPEAAPRFAAVPDKGLSKDVRQRQLDAVMGQYSQCISVRRKQLIGELAERRAVEREL